MALGAAWGNNNWGWGCGWDNGDVNINVNNNYVNNYNKQNNIKAGEAGKWQHNPNIAVTLPMVIEEPPTNLVDAPRVALAGQVVLVASAAREESVSLAVPAVQVASASPAVLVAQVELESRWPAVPAARVELAARRCRWSW